MSANHSAASDSWSVSCNDKVKYFGPDRFSTSKHWRTTADGGICFVGQTRMLQMQRWRVSVFVLAVRRLLRTWVRLSRGFLWSETVHACHGWSSRSWAGWLTE
jgi:hypothetical protein